MVRITALYGHPSDPAAFEKYYAESHAPIALRVPYVRRIDLAKAGPGLDGSRAAYYRTADLWFDDMEQMQAALASPEGQAMAGDLANFATGGVTILVSETMQAK